jgi:hypothetical protein
VVVVATIAFLFALYITVAAISAREGGSDERPYSFATALLIALLPALGAACAALAARRGWRAARGVNTGVGIGGSWLLLASVACSFLGVVGILAAWGYSGG